MAVSDKLTPDRADAIRDAAALLGVPPRDLATVIAYETIGTFSTTIKGGDRGVYTGLIQFSPANYIRYKVGQNTGFRDQLMNSVVPYLRDTGIRPGMGKAHIYSAVLTGGLNSDGDVPISVEIRGAGVAG